MKYIRSLLSVLLFSWSICAGTPSGTMAEDLTSLHSFENDLEGWAINGTDLDLGPGVIDWSITRSQELARDGASSLKYSLDNANDKGKIWIEKPFAVESNQLYQVTVEYAFASRMSAGPFFYIITGALKNHPTSARDLYPAFKDQTWNGSDANVGFTWQDKKYDFTVRSDDHGMLYIVLGIWGTWETLHVYYFDNVRVTLTKKPDSSQLYSFENDFEGWTSNGADLELGGGFIDWSITRVQEFALDGEDGTMSLKFDLNNSNGKGKIWVERPFSVEPRHKYKVTVDYAFHSKDCGDTPRFRIITGVFRKPPQSGDDLMDAFREKTTGCVWGWLHKSYEFTVKSKKSDKLYVVIGIRGTEEAHRTYNFDSVCVTLTKK